MDNTFLELMDSTFTVVRTETIKNPITNVVEGEREVNYGPYDCRLGRTTGSYIKTNPQGTIERQQILYTVIDADIKEGDIASINGESYIVGNVYRPNNHHIEADVTISKDS